MGKRERQREKKRKTQIQNRRGSKAFPPRPNRDDSTGAPGDERTGARGFPKGPAGKTHNKQASGPLSGGKEAEKISQLYHGGQELLVLGDGDFSFSAGLAKRLGRGGCGGLVSTSFDTAEEVTNKYGKKAQSCLQQLQRLGATVAHKVDATKLSSTLPKERRGAFDAVVFNFPHTGTQQVHLNQQLLRLFFAGVQRYLKSNGEVHVTIKTVPPYSRWDVPAQAEASGLHLARKAPFRFTEFPGYHHRTTEKDAMTFDAFEKRCVTFVFVAVPGKQGGKAVPSGGLSRNAGNADPDDASDQDAEGSEGGSSEDGSDSDVGHGGDVTGPGFEEEEVDGDDDDDDADDDDGEEEEKDPRNAAPAGKPMLKRGREAAGGEGNLKKQNKAEKSRKGNNGSGAGDVLENTAPLREEDKEGKGEEKEASKAGGGGGNERSASAPRLPRNKKLRLMMLRKERMDTMVRSEVDRFSSASAPGAQGCQESAGAAAAGGSKEESDQHAGSLSSVAKDEGKKNSGKAEAGASSGPRKAGPGKKGKNKRGRGGAGEA